MAEEKVFHCESDRDAETGELICLTHNKKICSVCHCEIPDEDMRCGECNLIYMKKVVEAYNSLKEVLSKIEKGEWKNDPLFKHLTIKQILGLRVMIKEADKVGINRLAKAYEPKD